jgi:hypothetical protein
MKSTRCLHENVSRENVVSMNLMEILIVVAVGRRIRECGK